MSYQWRYSTMRLCPLCHQNHTRIQRPTRILWNPCYRQLQHRSSTPRCRCSTRSPRNLHSTPYHYHYLQRLDSSSSPHIHRTTDGSGSHPHPHNRPHTSTAIHYITNHLHSAQQVPIPIPTPTSASVITYHHRLACPYQELPITCSAPSHSNSSTNSNSKRVYRTTCAQPHVHAPSLHHHSKWNSYRRNHSPRQSWPPKKKIHSPRTPNDEV